MNPNKVTLSELSLLRDEIKFMCNVYYGIDDSDIFIRRRNRKLLAVLDDCIEKKLKARALNAKHAQIARERKNNKLKKKETVKLKFLLWSKK